MEPVLIPLLELARAALRPAEREERLPKLLESPVCDLDPYEVRALRHVGHRPAVEIAVGQLRQFLQQRDAQPRLQLPRSMYQRPSRRV